MTDKIEHQPKPIYQSDLLDAVKCSCGWHSRWYYDGREFAWNSWKKHEQEAVVPAPHAISEKVKVP